MVVAIECRGCFLNIKLGINKSNVMNTCAQYLQFHYHGYIRISNGMNTLASFHLNIVKDS